MSKHNEQVPFLSYEDAIMALKQTQVEYGVHIDFHLAPAQYSRNGKGFCFIWTVKELRGEKGFVCIHRRVVDFPSRSFRTFPAMVVSTVSSLAVWIEEERARQKSALAQLPLFREA